MSNKIKKTSSCLLLVASMTSTMLSSALPVLAAEGLPEHNTMIIGDTVYKYGAQNSAIGIKKAAESGFNGNDLDVIYIVGEGDLYFNFTESWTTNMTNAALVDNKVGADKWKNVKYKYENGTYTPIDKLSSDKTIKVVSGYEAIVTEIGTDSITVIDGTTKGLLKNSIKATDDSKQTYSFATGADTDKLTSTDVLNVKAEDGTTATYTIKIAEGSGGGSVSPEQITKLKGSLQQLIDTAESMIEKATDDEKKSKLQDAVDTANDFLAGNPNDLDAILNHLNDLSDAITEFITGNVQNKINSVTIDPQTANVNQGGTKQFKVTVDATGNIDKDVSWAVYGENNTNPVAGVTIDGNGLLTVADTVAVNTKLTVKVTSNADNTKSDTANVTVVKAGAVTGVKLDKSTASVEVGKTTTLTATVEPANATNKAVTWKSSDENIATVSDGVVIGVSTGTATITVKTVDGSFTAKCEVTVTAATQNKINSVTIDPQTATVNQGGTKQFNVTVDATGNIDKSVSWAVYGEGNTNPVAGVTIDGNGLLTVADTVVADTKLTVKVTSNADNTKSDTANVTVVKVDKTALNNAITTAEAAKVNVVIADDASTVDKGVYFVNQATMDTFEAAIKDAKAVKDKATVTQDEVNKATTDLTTATTTFNDAKQVGTKDNGGTEKGTYTGNLISVTSNNTTVTDAVYKTVYSEVYVDDTTTLKFNVKKDGVFSTSSNSQDVKVTKIGDKSVANYATKGSESTIETVTFIEYTYTLQTGEIFDTTKNIEIELKDKTDNNKTYIVTFGTFQKK